MDRDLAARLDGFCRDSSQPSAEASHRRRRERSPDRSVFRMRERPPLERAQDFEGVEYGLTQQEIAQECSRCLRCDHFGYGGFRGGRQTW